MYTSASTNPVTDTVTVQVSDAAGQDSIERAKALLYNIPGGVEKATKAAMSRAVQKLRSESKKAILEKYDISGENLRLETDSSRQGRAQKESNVSVRYSFQNGVQATVTFAGHKIPLYRYGGTPKTPEVHKDRTVGILSRGQFLWVHPSVQYSGHQFRSTSQVPETKYGNDAFVQKMKSGHLGVFVRTGGRTDEGTDEIEELMGSSVPQMVGGQDVAERMTGKAWETFESELDKAVYRILTGWR